MRSIAASTDTAASWRAQFKRSRPGIIQHASQQYWDSREHISQQNKGHRVEARAQAIVAYGEQCVCCGESTPEFLTLDHVNGDGAAHRRQVGTKDMWLWSGRNDYPDILQLLCYNCNNAKHRSQEKICPHQQADGKN